MVLGAYLGPVSKAVDAQGEVAAGCVVRLDELAVAVEDGPAVLVLVHAGVAPPKVCRKPIVRGIPRLCARSIMLSLKLTVTFLLQSLAWLSI